MIQNPTSPVRSATGLQIWADADWQARNNTAPAKAGQMRPMIASARCSANSAISRQSVGGLGTFAFGSEQKWRHLGKSALAAKRTFAPLDARGQDAGRALMPDDLRHLGCRRRVAAAVRADDGGDEGYAGAGGVAQVHAL